jgi:hypothetical protein
VAFSRTGIVNDVLALLGSLTRITSFDSAEPYAVTARELWDRALSASLAGHPWKFAIKRQSVGASGDYVPAGENSYLYAYELPADNLRWLPWDSDDANFFDGEQEGNFILSDADAPLLIRYIAKVDEVGRWSPGFLEAFTFKLAWFMAKPVTGHGTMMDRMDALYQAALPAAKRDNGLSTGRRRQSVSRRSNWLDARNR